MNRPLACCALLLLTGVAFARSGSTFGAVPQDSPAKAPPPVRIDIESQVWPTDPAVVESARTGKTPLTAIGALRTPRALVLSGLATNGTGGQPVAPGDLRILPPGGYQFVVDFGSNGLTATIDDHPAPSKDDLVFGRRDVGGFRLRPLTPVAAAAGGTAPLSVDASTAGVVTVRWGPFGGDFELARVDLLAAPLTDVADLLAVRRGIVAAGARSVAAHRARHADRHHRRAIFLIQRDEVGQATNRAGGGRGIACRSCLRDRRRMGRSERIGGDQGSRYRSRNDCDGAGHLPQRRGRQLCQQRGLTPTELVYPP